MATETHARKLQDYIAHGFDLAIAEYFATGRRVVTQISLFSDTCYLNSTLIHNK